VGVAQAKAGGGGRACGPGWLAELGRKRGTGPVSQKIRFSFLINFLDFLNRFKFEFLKMKKTFSQVVPKIKVVQNLILYSFHLGHFSKF
jgi:hypothetical protein